MKLFKLEPISDDEGSRWHKPYDKMHGVVVRASNETEARNIAAAHCGDEGSGTWTDATQTSCVVVTAKGEARIILRDFVAG